MSIKLIASDIDGTIINSNHEVSAKTREVIQSLKDKGIRFALSTGRGYGGAMNIVRQLGLENEDIGVICLNGMETYWLNSDKKRIIDGPSFEEALRIRATGQMFHMGIMYCFRDNMYLEMDDLTYKDYQIGLDEETKAFYDSNISIIPIKSIYDLEEKMKTEKLEKIAYMQSADYKELVYDRLKEKLDDQYELMLVSTTWSEIAEKGVNKGNAVLKYAESYGIKPEEIMVFGDSENDISMFKIAEVAVAMENAIGSAKENANAFTVSNDEHGVAVFIEEYLKEND